MRTSHLIIIALISLAGIVLWADSSVRQTQQIMERSTTILLDSLHSQAERIGMQADLIRAQKTTIQHRDSLIMQQRQELQEQKEVIQSYEKRMQTFENMLDNLQRSTIPERYRPADPR